MRERAEASSAGGSAIRATGSASRVLAPTIDGDRIDWRALLEANLGVPFTDGNRVDVLRNGVEIFAPMLDAIRNAEIEVDFLTYVYWTGAIACEFAETLAETARRGVRTRVLLDAVGAKPMSPALLEAMRSAGVEVEWFRPLRFWHLTRTANRTHRKVLLCDGRIGFTGGVGIGEEWEGDARGPSEWRDTHFRIEGPAVRGLRAAFIENWLEATGSFEPPIRVWSHDASGGNAAIQVVRSTASFGWSDIATLLRTILAAARARLRIQTAYFVPDATTRKLLCEAVARGVEVDVIVPGPHMDVRLSQLAGEAVYRPLLEGGVRIWTYQKTMMHAKILLVDGELACTGTANFNQRSMGKDDEITVSILDRETHDTLDRHFEEDLEASTPIDLETWRTRDWVQRAQEKAARLFRREL